MKEHLTVKWFDNRLSSKSTLKPIKRILVIKSYLMKEHLTVKWFDNRLSSKSTLKPIKRILVIKSYLIKEHLTIKQFDNLLLKIYKDKDSRVFKVHLESLYLKINRLEC